MLEQFLNHIHKNNLCTKADKILVAVSGGLDSMVMLHLFKEAGFTVAVAHCNFQLRGDESDRDQCFVEDMCKIYNIPIFVNHFNTEQYSNQRGISIQMAARELRYEWFHEVKEQNGFACLATAHHVNDSMETALLNWVHGSSVDGFGGIPVKNGYKIRPLLFATREEINNYAFENSLKWCEDSSNLADDYQRNFIRHQVIPKLKELNPSLEETFLSAQRKIKDELDFIDDQFTTWKAKQFIRNGHVVSISKQALTHVTLLWRAIREFGFNFNQCHDAMLALSGQSGRKFLSETHQLVIDRDSLLISPLGVILESTLIESGDNRVMLGKYELMIDLGVSELQFALNANEAILDLDNLKFPLLWRQWRPGDLFYPLGMEHKKKISDFLIDKKISLTEKQEVTVLESDGQIIWVVGHRIDNRFKVTSKTRSVISFKLIS